MKHFKTLLFHFVFAVLLLNFCSISNAQDKSNIAEEINAVEANKMVAGNLGNENFVILDTRSAREYEGDHLRNSVFINFSAQDVKDQVLKLDKNKTYLIYCHSGGRSGIIQKFMGKNGYLETYNMKGGIVSWRSEGFKTVKD